VKKFDPDFCLEKITDVGKRFDFEQYFFSTHVPTTVNLAKKICKSDKNVQFLNGPLGCPVPAKMDHWGVFKKITELNYFVNKKL
jgi:hypothetical protein